MHSLTRATISIGLISALHGFAQAPGTVDTNYSVKLFRTGYATKVMALPDDKLLVVGFITEVDGASRSGVARLSADGAVDYTFDPGGGASDAYVDGVFVQPDGKILLCGRFSFFNKLPNSRLVRLNADGSVDSTLAIGGGFTGGKNLSASTVYDMVTSADGTIFVGGDFYRYNGINRTNLAKLSSTGTLDPTFNPAIVGGSFQSYVRSITLQNDGKIFITGAFTNVNALSRAGVARLNSDGTLDTSFDPGSGAGFSTSSQGVLVARILGDGKYLIGGDFTNYNGTARSRIARLNPDGSLDTTFDPGTGFDAIVESDCLEVLADGRLLVGGNFTSYNGTNKPSIVRLNSNGAIDPTFDTGTGPVGSLFSITRQSNGSIVIGGSFRLVDGSLRFGLARLSADGALDPVLQPSLVQSGSASAMLRQPDGKILLAGDFAKVGSSVRFQLARLNSDGSLDNTFGATLSGLNNIVNRLALRQDGKIVASGQFSAAGGLTRNRVALFNTDGTLDATFDPGTGPSSTPTGLCVQPDNKIVLAGSFTNLNGFNQSFLGRLTPTGAADTTFTPVINSTLTVLTAYDDGRLAFGGASLATVNGTNVGRLARTSADGVLDTGFSVGTFAGTPTLSTARAETGGKIWLSGNFSTVQGKTRNGLVRFNSDGSVDDTFAPALPPGFTFVDFQTTGEGRVVVGGSSSQSTVIRLNADGSSNGVFQTSSIATSFSRLAVLANDDILGASLVVTYNSYDYLTFRRIIGIQRPVLALSNNIAGGANLSINAETGRVYHVQFSTNLIQWLALTNLLMTSTNQPFLDPNASNPDRRFYRAFAP